MVSEEQQPIAEVEPVGGEDNGEGRRPVTRRAFLTGVLAGGAAGLAVAAGTGLGVYQVQDSRLLEVQAAAESEVIRLQGLVELYEKIEKVGLDGILQTGMVAVAAPLELVQRGAETLKKGLELIEAGVASLQEALPSAGEAVAWLKAKVEALADGIEKVQAAVDRFLDRATDNSVAARLAEALKWVLDRLPFEWGDKARDAFDRLVELIGRADELVREANTRLLDPVEQRWFSDDATRGVGPTFLTPLVEHLLDPLEAHLGKLAGLADAWQAKLAEPAQQALEERGRLREEIVEYRAKHGLTP
jgi:hypothetical protein